jgi:Bacterial dnaA protein helix-turn-helix
MHPDFRPFAGSANRAIGYVPPPVMVDHHRMMPFPRWKPAIQPLDAIALAACRYWGITRASLFANRRLKEVVRRRHIVFYLARELTSRSYPDIGAAYMRLDHTTILHGVRKIAALVDAGDEQTCADVAEIRAIAVEIAPAFGGVEDVA